jgi:hypothetical protein
MPQKVPEVRQAHPTLAELKLIPEDRVPIRFRQSAHQWLNLAKEIPKGRALVGTEKQFGIRSSSMKLMIARLKKEGLLSNDYHVIQRTQGDTVTIYIVHSAKTPKE